MAANGEDPAARPSFVVRSKLQPPVARPRVGRARLVEQCLSPYRKLTLVCAPAGWGKSTLLADWWASAGPSASFAWLALDPFDNDPARFWAHVAESLRMIDGDLGGHARSWLTAPRVDLVGTVLPSLVNDLVGLARDVVLVLDDYHVITSAEVHTGVAFLLDHLPPNVQLVVAARTRPPLPLARWRGRGDLVEIGPSQLAFSAAETLDLLNGLHHLGLDDSSVSVLTEATEGWPAALHLSALTLRAAPSVDDLVSGVARGNRHIDDYLASEVLAGLEPDTRTFLLHTSILDHLCGGLCDEVAERRGSERTLAALESANLFVLPLDPRREWYRYHQLFADHLRNQLGQESADLVPVLHRRAASWYGRNGRTDEAIAHRVAAGDTAAAADLIVDRWPQSRAGGRLETVLTWMDQLPPDAVSGDPRLCLIRASTLQELGRIDESERWLDLADHLTVGTSPSVASVPLRPGIAASRAVNAYYRGDADAIVGHARDAGLSPADESDYWSSVLHTTLGAAHVLRGDLAEATRILEVAVTAGTRSGHTLALLHALGWSAIALLDQNRGLRADSALSQAQRLIDAHPGLGAYYGTAMVAIARGQALEGEGRLPEADEQLGRAMHLATQGSAMIELAYAATLRGRIAARLGDATSASGHLRRAREAAGTCRGCPTLTVRIEAVARLIAGRPDDRSYVEPLSERERAVLRLLPTNLTQREIADALDISFNTVKTHTRNIFRKLAVETRAGAVSRARELGLL